MNMSLKSTRLHAHKPDVQVNRKHMTNCPRFINIALFVLKKKMKCMYKIVITVYGSHLKNAVLEIPSRKKIPNTW